jgi:signal transduction histidine kinase
VHLQTIKQRIFRMQRLLEDLLEYSRVGHGQLEKQTGSLRTLIDHAIELCCIPTTITLEVDGVDFEIETWLTPLETCLRNLIGNAVKHRDSPTGRIQIRFECGDEFIQLSVADDGRGIQAQHFERIFRMFETLRRRDEVEGSGMGLAFIKKTLETYGGRISVESPNLWSGTTFHLFWPNATRNQTKGLDR